jgi:hypothetical protein
MAMKTDSTDGEYGRSLEVHQKIEALYSEIEQHGVRLRGMRPADPILPRPPGRTPGLLLDPIVCALAIKAATTKRAVLAVCELGDGANAMALTRVLLENACLLEWLIRGDGRRRLEAYVLFTSVQHERVAAIIQRHAPRLVAAGVTHDVQSVPYHRAVWSATFRDSRDRPTRSDRPTWEFDPSTQRGRPISVRELFREIAGDEPSYEYDVMYGALGSDIVHSGPFSLSNIVQVLESESTFTLRPMPVPELRTVALAMSNAAMCLVLESLTEYLGLDLAVEFDALRAKVNLSPDDDRDQGPSR